MEYGAIDLHKKESQVRIMTEGGEVIDRRIATTRAAAARRARVNANRSAACGTCPSTEAAA